MVNKVECLICGKKITSKNQYVASHVKRIHNIDFYDYIEKYYENKNKDFKIEKCGFCDKDAIYKYDINHNNKTYTKNYKNGYFCQTDECKNNISLKYLGHKYNKKTFEHIGSKSSYLSKLYKISIIESKNKKYKNRLIKDEYKSDLKGFVLRYGEEEGNRRYKERCEKISKSNNVQWYIDKYGEEEGKKRWNDITEKIRNNNRKHKSRKSEKITLILEKLGASYIDEYKINDLNNYCDYYLHKYNTIIEFYGDYWHCNPKCYDKNYFHQYIKLSAKEIWEKDKKRLNNIFNFFNKKINIIIIWESSIINKNLLLKILEDNKNKNNIIYV